MRHHLLVRSCVAALVLVRFTTLAPAGLIQAGSGIVTVSFDDDDGAFPTRSIPLIFPGSGTVEWRGHSDDYGDAGVGTARYDFAETADGATLDVRVAHDHFAQFGVSGGRTDLRLDFTTDRPLRYHVVGAPEGQPSRFEFSLDNVASAGAESIDDPTGTIPSIGGSFPMRYSDDGYPVEYLPYVADGILPAGTHFLGVAAESGLDHYSDAYAGAGNVHLTLSAVPEPDGVWVAVLAVAALAVSGPVGRGRGR